MCAILVTGGAGFIGSHTCKLLAESGHKPIVYDNLTRGHRSAVQWGNLVVGDLSDTRLLCRTIEKHSIEAVIHFAALAYVRESMEVPALYWENNVVGTKSLLEAMQKTGVERFVFSSSCATYGIPQQIPIDVSCPPHPINPYGMTKLVCEWMIRDYARQYDWQYAILRYFNVAGSDPDLEVGEVHEPESHIIPVILLKALESDPEPVRIFGGDHPTPDGTCIRDYIHVMDLAAAHLGTLKYITDNKSSMMGNIALGHGTSILELLKICEEVTGRRIPYVIDSPNPGEPPCLIADPGEVWTTIGITPRFPQLRTMVEHAWQWMRLKHPTWLKLKQESLTKSQPRFALQDTIT